MSDKNLDAIHLSELGCVTYTGAIDVTAASTIADALSMPSPTFVMPPLSGLVQDKRMLVRQLLTTMFRGWILYEDSYEHITDAHMQPTRSEDDAMTEATGGDTMLAALLCLFGHWAHDVQSIAAYYGVGLARRQPDGSLLYADDTLDTILRGGKLEVVEIPPAPSLDCYWSGGQWCRAPEEADTAACLSPNDGD